MNNGILTVYVPKDTIVELVNITKPPTQAVNHTQAHISPNKTWSSIVTKNVPITETSTNNNAQIVFNEDGSATLKPPKDFLTNARKMWEMSLIDHFIGGSFDFKYVCEHAFKLWKNKGLVS